MPANFNNYQYNFFALITSFRSKEAHYFNSLMYANKYTYWRCFSQVFYKKKTKKEKKLLQESGFGVRFLIRRRAFSIIMNHLEGGNNENDTGCGR